MYSLPLTSQTRGPLPRAMMVSIAMMLPVLPPGRTRAARSRSCRSRSPTLSRAMNASIGVPWVLPALYRIRGRAWNVGHLNSATMGGVCCRRVFQRTQGLRRILIDHKYDYGGRHAAKTIRQVGHGQRVDAWRGWTRADLGGDDARGVRGDGARGSRIGHRRAGPGALVRKRGGGKRHRRGLRRGAARWGAGHDEVPRRGDAAGGRVRPPFRSASQEAWSA